MREKREEGEGARERGRGREGGREREGGKEGRGERGRGGKEREQICGYHHSCLLVLCSL